MPIDETGQFSISDGGLQADRFALPEPDDEVIVASTGVIAGEDSIWLDLGARMLGSPEERAPMLGSPEERTGESHHYSFRWWYDYSSDNSAGNIGVAGPDNDVAFHDTDFV